MEHGDVREVFALTSGQVSRLPSRSFREGVLDHSLEAALQNLLEKNPGIVPGSRTSAGSDTPSTFVTLGREVPVHGRSLDLLLVDQDGILTLVECKLLENPESRRHVLGQIMEYATNAVDAWGGGLLREESTKYWSQRGRDVDDVLSELVQGECDVDQFWHEVEANLEQRRFRLIVASDRLRPEVRRVLEFLNAELRSIEVLGLEMSCFGRDGESLILVPSIVGRTQAISDRKRRPTEGRRLWTYENLKQHYQSESGFSGDRLLAVLDWAEQAGALLEVATQNPIFGVLGRHGQRILTVYPSGAVYCFMGPERYGGSKDERDTFVTELNELLMFNYDDPSEVRDGRTSAGRLDQLADEEFNRFLDILQRYCTSH